LGVEGDHDDLIGAELRVEPAEPVEVARARRDERLDPRIDLEPERGPEEEGARDGHEPQEGDPPGAEARDQRQPLYPGRRPGTVLRPGRESDPPTRVSNPSVAESRSLMPGSTIPEGAR